MRPPSASAESSRWESRSRRLKLDFSWGRGTDTQRRGGFARQRLAASRHAHPANGYANLWKQLLLKQAEAVGR